mmetsp:Transcript_14123/g.17788  ORF Transcript_14123/g.17788 Transcript_14123/m.17788 type:complete len:489 (+) Transcript_14123:100-1566(+)
MFFQATTRRLNSSLLEKTRSMRFLNRRRRAASQQSILSEHECLCKLAEELNNVAVDLYMENDRTFTVELYKNAAEAIMATVQPKECQIVALGDARSQYISQIIEGKERVYNIRSCSELKSKQNGVDNYQWSEMASDVTPKCISEAMKICQSEGNDEYTSAATIMYNMGLIHMKHEGLGIAEKVFELAMEMRPEPGTAGNLSNALVYAALLNNLGYIKYRRDDMDGAKRCFFEALQIAERAPSQRGNVCENIEQKYKHLGTIYFNIGIINGNLGLCDESIRAFGFSLEMQKSVLGETHPDIAVIQHNIGMFYLVIGRVNDATNAFLEALRISRFALGNDHCYAAKALFYLGRIHVMRGEYKEALHVFQETLRVERAALGMNHSDTIATLCEIAQVHYCKGHVDEAISVYNDALVVAKGTCSKNNGNVTFILSQMMKVHIESGNITEATRIHRETSKLVECTDSIDEFDVSFEFGRIKDVLSHPPAAAAA